MSHIATALLYASRYAHGRGTGAYQDVIAAAYALWPQLDTRDRAYLSALWRDQLPGELRGYPTQLAEWMAALEQLDRL